MRAKLVRDKVKPREGREEYVRAVNTTVGKHMALALKLHEEVGEVISAPWDPTEYGDVMHVLLAMAELHGVSVSDVYAAMGEKRERLGGFKMGMIWIDNEVPG